MTTFNFADNFPTLKRWEKHISKKDSNDQFDSDRNLLLNINYKLIFNLISKQKSLYIPPLVIFSITLLITSITLIPRMRISSLRENHDSFNLKYQELESLNNELMLYSNELKSLLPFESIDSPSVLFAHYLQQTVPIDVRLSNYALDAKAFVINASSNDINSLNDFISLLNKSLLVKEGSLKVKRLIKQSKTNTFQQSNINNPHTSFLEISGELNHINLEKKLSMYKDTYNFGKINKLDIYLKAIKSFEL